MRPGVANENENSIFYGDYVGRDYNNVNIILFQDSEREYVVTHNANIKPVAYFTGREEELQKLRQWIEEGRKSVLVSGMGGIGKTHICRKLFEEYLEEYEKDKSGRFWHIGYIEYEGDMGNSLKRCLKYKEQADQDLNQEAAWKELEHLAANGKLLLFVDNVNVSMGEDPGIRRLMGIPGAIVLTSRRRTFSREFEPFRIGFLSTKQCKEIYERIRFEDSDERTAEEEVPDLEYIIDTLAARHTITVEFLAHLAWTKQWTVQKLRVELKRNGFHLEYTDEEDKLVNIQKAYEALYDMSVLTEAEKNILEAFSIFPYIPLEAEICNQWLLADAGASESDDILIGLYRKGWLQFEEKPKRYSMHPVFAQFIFDKCKPTAEKHSGLIRACQENLDIPERGSVLECQSYIPFAESMIERLGMRDDIKQADFISSLAFLLHWLAQYKKAEELYKKVLQIKERVLGEDHPDTATSYNNLAVVYERQGKYSEAEELYKKSQRITKRVLGEDHPDTATIYNNLAVVYAYQRKYSEAEELYKKSLQIRERVLGEDHPDTVRSYNNFAVVYANQGKYSEAEELYKKSQRITKRVLGEDHPDTATIYNNLAVVYANQGKYSEAEELYKKSLQIRERVLGEDHPDTVASYNNLAVEYDRQGKYSEAEELYKKSLQIRERVLGEDHPDTVAIYNNLAGMYADQGKYSEAEELYKKSLQIRERMLGEEHLSTATSYKNLAVVYFKQEKYELAMSYVIKAYKVLISKLGLGHLRTEIMRQIIEIEYSIRKPEGNFEQWLEEQLKEPEHN